MLEFCEEILEFFAKNCLSSFHFPLSIFLLGVKKKPVLWAASLALQAHKHASEWARDLNSDECAWWHSNLSCQWPWEPMWGVPLGGGSSLTPGKPLDKTNLAGTGDFKRKMAKGSDLKSHPYSTYWSKLYLAHICKYRFGALLVTSSDLCALYLQTKVYVRAKSIKSRNAPPNGFQSSTCEYPPIDPYRQMCGSGTHTGIMQAPTDGPCDNTCYFFTFLP